MQNKISMGFDTLNFQLIHANLSTSGQPTAEQLQLIAASGYNTLINLALTNASRTLANEDVIAMDLGLDYIHLPIHWERPSLAQAKRVLQLIDQLKMSKIWLHCALNYRVSALMYVYRVNYLNVLPQVALPLLHRIWTPDTT